MTDAAVQRLNMVESQVRPSDVTDRRIARAMLEIPRERFVSTALKPLAYMDDHLPAGESPQGSEPRKLLAPRTFAKLIELANIGTGGVVLDVGCASGYSSAVLARLCETVVAVESSSNLASSATETLRELNIDNVVVVTGPLQTGYASEGPYDAIVVQGAVDEVPDGLLDQLKDGGRLVAIEAGEGVMHAVVWRRLGETFDERRAFEAFAPRLPGFERAPSFAL